MNFFKFHHLLYIMLILLGEIVIWLHFMIIKEKLENKYVYS